MLIESIYSLIDIVLPFSWAQYFFMKNALLAILLLAPILGIIGTMVINNKMTFFSDAIGHSAFTGIAIGTILGIQNLTFSTISFAIIFAIVITFLKYKSFIATDTLISVFASITIAFGIAIMSHGGNFKKYSNFLIGDILSISNYDLLVLLIIFFLVLITWYFIINKLIIITLSSSLARSQGIRIYAYDFIFTILVALVITFSIQWIGVLLINSLLVLPAAAARNLSKNVAQYHLVSILIATFSGIIGLICSFYIDISAGPSIVLFSGFLYFLSLCRSRN